MSAQYTNEKEKEANFIKAANGLFKRLSFNVQQLGIKPKNSGSGLLITSIPAYFVGHDYKNQVIEIGRPIYGPILKSKNKRVIFLFGKAPGFYELRDKLNFCGSIGREVYDIIKDEIRKSGDFPLLYVGNLCRWNSVEYHLNDSVLLEGAKDCLHILYNELYHLRPDIFIIFGGKQFVKLLNAFLKDKVKTFDYGDILDVTFHLPHISQTVEFPSKIVPLEFKKLDQIRTSIHVALHNKVPRDNKIKIEDEEEIINYSVIGYCAEEINTLLQILKDIDSIQGTKTIALDCEWHGRLDKDGSFLRSIQLSYEKDGEIKTYVIAISDSNGNYTALGNSTELKLFLDSIVFDRNVIITGSFIYTDATWLKKEFKIDLLEKYKIAIETDGKLGIGDVAMAAAVHNENLSLDLCNLARYYLNIPRWDKELNQWLKENHEQSYGRCEDRILFEYAAKDTYYTLKLWNKIKDQIYNPNKTAIGPRAILDAYLNNLRMCAALIEILENGIRVNVDKFNSLKTIFKETYDKLLEKIRTHLNWKDFTPTKSRHIIAALFGEKYTGAEAPVMPPDSKSLGLRPIKSTDKSIWNEEKHDVLGRAYVPAVDKDVMNILCHKNPGNEILMALRDISVIDTALKGVFGKNGWDSFLGSDGRLRCGIISPTTETGRCRGANPNLLNISNKKDADYSRICGRPIYIRSCFTADDGNVFGQCDFVAAELMLLGIMSNDRQLIDDCIRSALPETDPNYFDVHSHIAVHAFRLQGVEPTKKGLKEANKSHLRIASKAIIYGIMYAREAASIKDQLYAEDGLDLSIEEVEKIKEYIFSRYEKVRPHLEILRNAVEHPGYQVNYFGRIRTFTKTKDAASRAHQERESLNFPFQSTTADCLDHLAFLLLTHPDKEKLGYKLLLPLHDAIWLEAPKDKLDEINNLIRELEQKILIRQWDIYGNHIGEDVFYLKTEIKWNKEN